MKINEVAVNKNQYLYEGLTPKYKKSMQLWESVGSVIAEAQLSPQQISNLFQQIEQGAIAGGNNRTTIGKGKDVATAVQAAYKDLVGKVQNSGPMQNVDAAYNDVANKLKTATGGDQGVMQYVQKYRDFAKAHPTAQKLIYAALIAAAGISGAGAGGAAALGLLKMTDKLLQGEKFSTAVGQGIKTGGMAYAAGQVGKAVQGNQPQTTTTTLQQHTTGLQPASPWDIPAGVKKEFPLDKFTYKTDGIDLNIYNQAGKLVATRPGVDAMNESIDRDMTLRMWSLNESLGRRRNSVHLTESGVLQLFVLVEGEGWDKFKAGAKQAFGGIAGMAKGAATGAKNIASPYAQAAKEKAAQFGQNMTNKITLDKLQSAWKAAGSPTDSDAIASALKSAGVSDEDIAQAYKSMNIPYATEVDQQQAQQAKDQEDELLSNKLTAQAANGTPRAGGSALGSFLRGAGAVDAANAVDANKRANTAFTNKPQRGLDALDKQPIADLNVPYTTTSAPVDSKTGEQTPNVSWDPNKSMLDIDGQKYQKTNKGWKDWNTKDIIDPKDARELDAAFDQATGRKPVPSKPSPTVKPIQIKTKSGETITKNDQDGKWYTEDGGEITDQNTIDTLERLAKTQYQNRQMSGVQNPASRGSAGVQTQPEPADTDVEEPEDDDEEPAVFTSNRRTQQQPEKKHTGGRKAGQELSQTANAQRKREQRKAARDARNAAQTVENPPVDNSVQSSQDAIKAALRQRQSQGLAEYAEFKRKVYNEII